MKIFFSTPRMNTYSHDRNLYIKNIQESQRIYIKLHVLEITLRNKINEHFKNTLVNKKWLLDILYDFNYAFKPTSNKNKTTVTLFDITKSKLGFFVGYPLYKQVKRAFEQLNQHNTNHAITAPITHDSLIGSLTLGFWVCIFKEDFLKHYRQFDLQCCNDLLIDILGVKPTNVGNLTEIAINAEELNRIREFRNRVSHYEYILHHINAHELLIDKYISQFDKNNKLESFILESNQSHVSCFICGHAINRKLSYVNEYKIKYVLQGIQLLELGYNSLLLS